MVLFIKKKEKLRFIIDLSMMNTQIEFAIPLGVVAIVQSINTYIDNLFISNSYTPEQYAAYANGATDIPFVGIITVSVAAVILPKMSKEYNLDGNFNNVLQIWSESSKKTAIIMYPIFWIAILFSIGYIQFVFSDKYVVTSTPIFMIYLMKFPLYCTVYGNILIVLKMQKYVMYNSIIGVILGFILNFLFLKVFGIIGPAIANVLVQYIVVALQLLQIRKSSKVKLRCLMPYKELTNIFVIPAIVAIPFYIFSSFLPIQQWVKLVIFGILIYGITLIVYCRFNYIDSNSIKKYMKRMNE
jgi:O-antigen/teichoic acid export membrane protein